MVRSGPQAEEQEQQVEVSHPKRARRLHRRDHPIYRTERKGQGSMSYYRHPPRRFQGPGGAQIGVPPLTPVVKTLIIICGGIWLLQFILASMSWGAGLLEIWLGVTPALVITRGMIWQPFTYMFLHSQEALSHILMNMLFLYMFGGELERQWGSRGFLIYYLVCGTGAGVIVVLTGILSAATAGRATIGASGAIYGLILAYGMLFSNRVILFLMFFPMRVRTFAWIAFGIAFLSALGRANTGTSHIAHLGGGLVGYLYLKRVWRFGEFYRELKWKLQRRKFKVIPPDDQDPLGELRVFGPDPYSSSAPEDRLSCASWQDS